MSRCTPGNLRWKITVKTSHRGWVRTTEVIHTFTIAASSEARARVMAVQITKGRILKIVQDNKEKSA